MGGNEPGPDQRVGPVCLNVGLQFVPVVLAVVLDTPALAQEFERLLACLVEGNQAWAKTAPVLALGVVNLRFAKNQQDNRAAVHDLGLATANLVVEATSRDLAVHQMIGILPDKARELYQIPEHYEAWTALAIGYQADPAELPEALKARDLAPRQRKPLSEFVFTGTWGQSSPLLRTADS